MYITVEINEVLAVAIGVEKCGEQEEDTSETTKVVKSLFLINFRVNG